MRKVLSIAMVTLMVAGSAAFACDTCGCTAKKAENKKAACSGCAAKKADKAACTKCTKDKACEACAAKKAAPAKKCGADCTKPCCAKPVEAK